METLQSANRRIYMHRARNNDNIIVMYLYCICFAIIICSIVIVYRGHRSYVIVTVCRRTGDFNAPPSDASNFNAPPRSSHDHFHGIKIDNNFPQYYYTISNTLLLLC